MEVMDLWIQAPSNTRQVCPELWIIGKQARSVASITGPHIVAAPLDTQKVKFVRATPAAQQGSILQALWNSSWGL